MSSRRSRPRRFLLPAVLAAVLAGEITGLALARTLTPTTSVAVDAPVAVDAAPAAVTQPIGTTRRARAVEADVPARDAPSNIAVDQRSRSGRIPTSPAIGPGRAARAATGVSSATGGANASGGRGSSRFSGTNRVWIPALGVNKRIQSFPCSRTRPPDAGVYRWGCAGRNNVYLLSHAWSTFKPLHDAYVSGRLKKGMEVVYADGASRVHTYSVIWWKVTAPTTAASWAWAPLSSPGMTLQTCIGSKSQYRLMVRLDEIG